MKSSILNCSTLRPHALLMACGTLLAAQAWAADPACRATDGSPANPPVANTSQGVEFGLDNSTCTPEANAFGYGNNASGVSSTAVGESNSALGGRSTAVGSRNEALSRGAPVAFRIGDTVVTEFFALNTAVGNSNRAFGSFATAVGSRNFAGGDASSALGFMAGTTGRGSLAVGAWDDRNGNGAVDYNIDLDGDGTFDASNETAVATGTSASAVGAGNLAAGERSSALGTRNSAYGRLSTAVGYANFAGAEASTAMGVASTASGYGSTAVGTLSIAGRRGSLAIGNWYDRNGDEIANQDLDLNGDGLTDAGSEQVVAGGEGSVAVGAASRAMGDFSSAIGFGNVAEGARSNAVGYNSQALADDSTAIGTNSVADRANTVSVGAVGSERQIVNVAAGTAPTDVTNVAQVQAGDATTLASANAYTDTRLRDFSFLSSDIERRVRDQGKRIDRNGAMSAAMLNMAINASGGSSERGRLAVGAGFQGGEEAVSVGYGRRLGRRGSFSLGGAFSGSESSAGVGFGLEL